jgi:RHS repeat-associated protein
MVNIKLKTTAVTQGAFGYDASGRRQDRTVGGTPTGYLHNGINPVQEQQGATTNNVFAGGTDTFFSRIDANGNRTYLRDRLGSTLGLVDSAGTVQTSYTYEPFGKMTATGQASTNPYQFTGRENDGLGLMHYRARYYSPMLHRFVSEDPIGFGGGINQYVYVGNGPVNRRDPFGLLPLDPESVGNCVVASIDSFLEDLNLLERKPGGQFRPDHSGCLAQYAGAGGVFQKLLELSNSPTMIVPCIKGRWPQHHIFPQDPKLAPRFRAAEINIDDFTVSIDPESHYWVHGPQPSWNQDWEEWLDDNPVATRQQIIEQGLRMMQEYSIEAFFRGWERYCP